MFYNRVFNNKKTSCCKNFGVKISFFNDNTSWQNLGADFLPSQESSIHLKSSVLLMESETKEKYGSHCLISDSIELPEHNYANTVSEAIYENSVSSFLRQYATTLNEKNTILDCRHAK